MTCARAPRKEQRQWLKDHSGAYAAVVAEDRHNGVVGFGSLSPYRERPAYTGTAEVSLYIHTSYRSRGVGQDIFGFLQELAVKHGFRTLIARVTDSNQASHKLFAKAGFDLVGVERQVGRKFNQWLGLRHLPETAGGGMRRRGAARPATATED